MAKEEEPGDVKNGFVKGSMGGEREADCWRRSGWLWEVGKSTDKTGGVVKG